MNYTNRTGEATDGRRLGAVTRRKQEASGFGNHPKYADLLIAKKLASVYSRVFL